MKVKSETYRAKLSGTGKIKYFVYPTIVEEAHPNLKQGMSVKITIQWEEE